MKRRIKLLLALHLTLTLLPAQITPEQVCGLPHISAVPTGTPVRVQRLAKPGALTFKVRKNILSDENDFIDVAFTRIYSDANFEVYGETAQIDSGRIITANVDTLVRVFRDATFPGSIDSTRGIKSIADGIFGPPPDINGDGKMVILLLDIRDDYEEGVSESFVSGYFDPLDQIGGANNQDIVYLDVFPADLSGFRAQNVYSTLAHEYQHLIHFGRDRQEQLWVNEGLSELSPVLMGLPHRSFSHYLANTNLSLTQFTGSLADYARSALFFLYSWIQLGTPFIQDLIANTGTGTIGFASALSNHTTLGLVELVRNWHLANFIHGSGELGYGDEWAIPDPLMQRSLYSFPTTVSATVNAYSAHWTLVSHGSNLMLTGSATQNVKVTVFKGADRTPLDGSSILSAGFTDDDYGVTYKDLIVLTSTGNLASIYNLDVVAEGNFDEFTIKYDNNLSVFDQLFIGFGDFQAVVEFNIPSIAIDLTSISFLSFNSRPVVLRLYADTFTSATLFFLDTIPSAYQLQWAPHRLPAELDLAGKTLFVGLTGVALAYNEAQDQQWSYLGDAAAENLDSLKAFSIDGGQSFLVGNWSVRVSYLIPGQPPIVVPESIVGNFYANPFIHDGTLASVVRINVDHEDAVNLRIYNLLGQQVWHSMRPAGDSAPIAWRGITSEGRPLPSGVYFAVIRIGTLIESRKLVLIR
ncbi:MAG: hypothetical protein IIA59_01170 [Candidatus Marinimicrobia bacterium]|nr:hypothetical protein [Candidatus Neomarinimicrobiota bacterium]